MIEQLTYTDDDHRYAIGEQTVISVTQLLTSTQISKMPDVAWAVIERARRRGKSVHEACEFLDQGDLDWRSLSHWRDPGYLTPEEVEGSPKPCPRCKAPHGEPHYRKFTESDKWHKDDCPLLEIFYSVKAYVKFKADSGFKPLLIEEIVLIEVEGKRCAGRFDRTGLIANRHLVLDLKTTEAEMPSWALQTALYSMGLPPLTTPPYKHGRAALRLRKNGTYRFNSYDDPADLDIARQLLIDPDHPAVQTWKNNHGISETIEEY